VLVFFFVFFFRQLLRRLQHIECVKHDQSLNSHEKQNLITATYDKANATSTGMHAALCF